MSIADRVLILGADGQLGQALTREFSLCRNVWLGTRRSPKPEGGMRVLADLAKPECLHDLVHQLRPTLILNAAAYTAVDRAEREPQQAQRINADAVAALAQAARELGAVLVHYSTDYVFPGDGDTPRSESCATDPVNVYGRSKLAGEGMLEESGCEYLLLRTAWVYSAGGHNFLRSMLRLATRRSVLEVVDDQIGTPTWVGLLAQLTRLSVQAGLRGLYHATAAGETSWFGFATEIFRLAQAHDLLTSAPRLVATDTASYHTAAQRPLRSVLDCTRLQRALGISLPPWEQSLHQCLSGMAGWRAHFSAEETC